MEGGPRGTHLTLSAGGSAPPGLLAMVRSPLAGVGWVGKIAELEITGKVWWEGRGEEARGGVGGGFRCLHPRGPSGATSGPRCGRRSGKRGEGPQRYHSARRAERPAPRWGSRGLERKPSPPSRRPELQSSPGVRGEKSAGSLTETSSGSRSGAGSGSPRSNLASHRVVAAGPASPRSAEAQLPLEEAPPEPGVPPSLASRPRPRLRLGAGGSEFPVRGGAPLPTLGILRHANALSLSKHLFGNAKIQRGMPSPGRAAVGDWAPITFCMSPSRTLHIPRLPSKASPYPLLCLPCFISLVQEFLSATFSALLQLLEDFIFVHF